MSENIEQLEFRHKKELKKLQSNCSHPKFDEPYESDVTYTGSSYTMVDCSLCGKTFMLSDKRVKKVRDAYIKKLEKEDEDVEREDYERLKKKFELKKVKQNEMSI